jgi:hypothetical protein
MIYSLIRNFQLEMANIFVYKSFILCIQGSVVWLTSNQHSTSYYLFILV